MAPPGPLGACKLRPKPAVVFGPLAGLFGRPLCASSGPSALGPLPPRSARRARGPRAPFGAPVRGLAPLASLPGAGPPLPSPRSPARPLVRRGPFPGSAGARWPRCPGVGLAPLRAPCSVRPCSVSAAPVGLRVAPRGAVCGPASRLRARALPAGPPGRPLAALFAWGAPRFGCCARPPAGACCACGVGFRVSGGLRPLCLARCRWLRHGPSGRVRFPVLLAARLWLRPVTFSPTPFPFPRPAGAGEKREARLGGFAPAARGAFFAPLWRLPPPAARAPVARCGAWLTVLKLSTNPRPGCAGAFFGHRSPIVPGASRFPFGLPERFRKSRAGKTLTRPVREICPVGLDNPGPSWYVGEARPVPLLRGPPLAGCPWTARSRSTFWLGGFFICRVCAPVARGFSAPVHAPAALMYSILVRTDFG